MHIHVLSNCIEAHMKLVSSLRSIGYYVTIGTKLQHADYVICPSEEQSMVLGESEMAIITDTIQKAVTCSSQKT